MTRADVARIVHLQRVASVTAGLARGHAAIGSRTDALRFQADAKVIYAFARQGLADLARAEVAS